MTPEEKEAFESMSSPENSGLTKERTCANCACSKTLKHPQLVNTSVMFCRRNGPLVVQGPNGQNGLTFQPTQGEHVCYDGWRPIGTLPGDRVPAVSFDTSKVLS